MKIGFSSISLSVCRMFVYLLMCSMFVYLLLCSMFVHKIAWYRISFIFIRLMVLKLVNFVWIYNVVLYYYMLIIMHRLVEFLTSGGVEREAGLAGAISDSCTLYIVTFVLKS